MDWLLRPVVRRMCLFESLKDGTLDLLDIALMNDALDLMDHNQKIYEKHIKANPNG